MPKRNLQLDLLRGIAVVLVFGRHLEIPRPDGVLGGLSEVWFHTGWLGVDLFFVLSGFLIGGLLITELKRHGTLDIGRFLVRRGLKIYPAYLALLLYASFVPALKAALGGGSGLETLGAKWSELWPNLLFLQNYVGPNPLGHTWTLAVEEHFYLTLPFLLAAVARADRVRWILPLCIAAVPAFLGVRLLSIWAGDPYSVGMGATHLRLDALLFGVGIRAWAEFFPAHFAGIARYRIPLLLAGLLLWAPNVFVPPETVFVRSVGLTANFLGSGAFLLAAFHTNQKNLGSWGPIARPLAVFGAWIGVYSYAIYLWHVTAIRILEREFATRLLASIGEGSSLVWLIATVVVCAGAVLAGVVATKLVEWPVLRLRDRYFPSRSTTLPTDAAGSLQPSERRASLPSRESVTTGA